MLNRITKYIYPLHDEKGIIISALFSKKTGSICQGKQMELLLI